MASESLGHNSIILPEKKNFFSHGQEGASQGKLESQQVRLDKLAVAEPMILVCGVRRQESHFQFKAGLGRIARTARVDHTALTPEVGGRGS